jgi:hypothetical protein
MVFLVPALVVMFAVGVRISLPVGRRLRMSFALRGDWWTGFEREFRAYASRAWEAARQAERSG